jgi:ribosomal protein S18 acetylase RimI-like enzyme
MTNTPADHLIRSAFADDAAFLADMLNLAAHWRPGSVPPPRAVLLADLHLARYVAGWPRPGDTGVVAETPAGQELGAAWYRYFDPAAPGYGFVAPEVPELSIAVVAAARGQGLGRRLLGHLVTAARQAGVGALSLSVEEDNPARNLYVQSGFRTVSSAAGAATMLLRLDPQVSGRAIFTSRGATRSSGW